MMPTTIKVVVLCLALTSTLTACTAAPTAEPSQSSTTRSAELPESESPEPTMSTLGPVPTSSNATFNGLGLDVAFSFHYPASWTVTNTGQPNQEGGPFVITNEADSEVASLVVQPYLEVEPCRGVCGDMAVSSLGEVSGQGTLANRTYVVQTKAMDLTSRRDLQEANKWENNVLLITGVTGVPSKNSAEDPVHFTTLAGIQTNSTLESTRPIVFGAYRYFGTLTEAKA